MMNVSKFLFGKEVTDSQEDVREWTQNPLRWHLSGNSWRFNVEPMPIDRLIILHV
jgi:hypothetical protein